MKFKFPVLILLLLSLPFTLFGLTLEEERKYGKEVFLEIARSVPVNNDPYISVYVKTIKDRLESNATLAFPITLTIIDSQTADAFATIGGYVFITMGLIGMCDKEEELAGVLAHEFAHVSKRHIAKRVEKEKYINIASIASLLAAILIPDPKAKGAILTMGMGSAQALSLKYSREDEDEADRVGSVIADKTGYGGLGTADFLRKLRAGGGDTVLPQYLLTHPYHEERIIKLESMWQRKRIDIDTAFFPYLVARAKILHKDARGSSEDIWINKYIKDKTDPVNIYGASLMYAAKGDADKSVDMIIEMKSPYKNMFLGEMLVDAHRFKEAAVVLKDETYPASRFYLAKAYEGAGDRDMAIDVLGQILRYGNVYPEVYYRYGMLLGRKGQEARGHEYLGRFYLETGRLDIARTHFEKAISRYGINSREAADLLKILDGMKGEPPRPNK
jgi:predicted Zn-dependent protease